MQIYSISTNKYNYYKRCPNFKALKVSSPTVAGHFKSTTVNNLNQVINAYNDIIRKLERVTPEGIRFLEEQFKNITIGDNLIFHNCGEEKTSVLVRMAESMKYRGLLRIIERQSGTTWGNKIAKRAFLVEHNEKLIKTDEPNNPKIYPKEKVYYSEKEFEDEKIEENLNEILGFLDQSMLKFRIFLNQNMSNFKKLPSGKLPINLNSRVSRIENNLLEIDKLLQELPKKVSLEIRREFENYKMQTGSSTQVFKNLGEDDVTISFHPIVSESRSDLKRMTVYNSKGDILRTFVVTEDGKLVKNLNQKAENFLPSNLVFADEEEILKEEYQPDFEKYLKLYEKALLDFSVHIKNSIESRNEKKSLNNIELSLDIQNAIQNILENYSIIQQKLNTLNPITRAKLKKNIDGLYAPAGRKGLTFDNEDNTRVYFLPINSDIHSNLIRLTITKPNGENEIHLIKDNKFVVKNYNPAYPAIIPKVLTYSSEISGIGEYLMFLDKKVADYKKYANIYEQLDIEEKIKNAENAGTKSLERQKELTKKRKERDLKEIELKKNRQGQKTYEKELAKQTSKKLKEQELMKLDLQKGMFDFCKMKLKELGQNLKEKNESFNLTLREIQQKIEEFLEQQA